MGDTHVHKPLFDARQILTIPGRAEDAANLMLFLASDEGRFITAETIDLDGGYGAKV